MKQYIVDTFTNKLFSGNPAAVCIMEQGLSEEIMLKIAIENNLSETAFVIKENGKYRLRWFTPGGEIDLCGHATLATAFVIMNYLDKTLKEVVFSTKSGDLKVVKNNKFYEMDFPVYDLKKIEITRDLIDALGVKPKEVYMGRDLLCIFDNEDIIRAMKPSMEKLKNLDGLLLHISAKGKKYDCVSRSFAPKLNVIEDPVCGSGHCHIAPYWIKRLKKNKIIAYQASSRGGTIYCQLVDDRVKLSGEALLYAISDIRFC